MRDVTCLAPVEEVVRLEAFPDEPCVVRVTRIDFLKHTMTLVPMDTRCGGSHADL
jgi:hypothetical protein